MYTDRCCIAPGKHRLTCYNNPPARGWKNEYLMIDGHRYCDNFVGFKSMQKIAVTGRHIEFLIQQRVFGFRN